jgi:hypothetical protein
VAAEGFAGREAAAAARVAGGSAEQQRVLLHYHLLLELVRQGDPGGGGAPLAPGDMSALEQRARSVLVSRRTDTSLSPASAFEALAELAEVFEPCGLPGDPTRARLPQLSAEIGAVIQDLARWAELAGPSERGCIRLLAESAALTQRCFRVAIRDAQTLLEHLWELIQRWRMSPEPISAATARPEWLLDGWEQICLVWDDAAQASTWRSALLEMVLMVPAMPRQLHDWVGVQASETAEFRRQVRLYEDWRTGASVPRLIARNEKLRAIAA